MRLLDILLLTTGDTQSVAITGGKTKTNIYFLLLSVLKR